jgi:hypothetical protein
MNTQEDPEAAQELKQLHEFKSSSVRIDVGRFITLVRMWELVMGHAKGFGRKNFAYTVSQFHHDNAPSHTSVFTQQFLVKYNMAVIPHPPYSPDLAPCDFFLFPKIKLKLKGRRFDTIQEIQAQSQRRRDTLTEKDFQETFQKCKLRWDRCLHAGGNYPEGDGGR